MSEMEKELLLWLVGRLVDRGEIAADTGECARELVLKEAEKDEHF